MSRRSFDYYCCYLHGLTLTMMIMMMMLIVSWSVTTTRALVVIPVVPQRHHTNHGVVSQPSSSSPPPQQQRRRRAVLGIRSSSLSLTSFLSLRLQASPTNYPRDDDATDQRRNVLLSRTGPYFQFDRRSGTIEFGATANLVTQLLSPSTVLNSKKNNNQEGAEPPNLIEEWLRNENKGLAMSIWDPKLMTNRGQDVYRLQIMTLQFVTITLAPWVDVQMWTVDNNNNNNSPPEFRVQSIGFEPNIQILPGMRLNGDALGIVIEVAGVLRPGTDGTSVAGSICFQTSGKLPPPLRILPVAVLRAAADTINSTICKFAIASFQKGAKRNFQEFVQQYELNQKMKR